MTEQIREQLSALLDGELPRDEVGLLVRRLDRDPELRRAFGRYALIGETLRAPGGRVASPAFAAKVAGAIDGPVLAPVRAPAAVAQAQAVVHHPQFWRRPVVRTALAASAAAAAVLFFRPEATQAPVATVAQLPSVAVDSAAAHSPTPARAQRLASYMVAHSQYSTPMVRRNVLTGLLAADPGLTTVAFDLGEAP